MYRLSLTRITAVILFIAFWVIIWNVFLDDEDDRSEIVKRCNMTSEYLSDLEKLLEKVHNILEFHDVPHILCYGSLWGQIRMSQLLPWSEKAELCTFKKQLDEIDEGLLYGSFERKFLRLRYFSANGFFIVEDIHKSKPFVEIYVFQQDDEQQVFKRTGWKRGLLPPHCDWTPSLDCFPTYLIADPLPAKPLGNNAYPVPMGGIELQKYHYANSWYKKLEIKIPIKMNSNINFKQSLKCYPKSGNWCPTVDSGNVWDARLLSKEADKISIDLEDLQCIVLQHVFTDDFMPSFGNQICKLI